MQSGNGRLFTSSENYSEQAGPALDGSQLVTASAIAVVTGTAAGALKLQASNQSESGVWVDVPDASIAISGAGNYSILWTKLCYAWIRFVKTVTGAGVQTITTVADVAKSLNSKYFLINAGNSGVAYYVWMNVNSEGVDPAIAGKTGVEIVLATDATANDVADAVAAALDALATFAAPNPAANVITVTNSNAGPFVPAVDVNAGFVFAVTAPTGGAYADYNMQLELPGE